MPSPHGWVYGVFSEWVVSLACAPEPAGNVIGGHKKTGLMGRFLHSQVPKKRYALFRALMRALRRLFWRAILFLANTPLLTMLSIIG